MANWHKSVLWLLLALVCPFVSTAGEVCVTDVTAHQRYPWNGLVDIVVTMGGATDDIAQAVCFFTASNSATGAAVPITSISQRGADVGSGTTWTRRFVWNASNDVGAVKIDDLAIAVDTEVLDGVQLWENGPCWAPCNVGATKPEEYGYHFWWGDTVGYKYSEPDNGWISENGDLGWVFLGEHCPTSDMDRSMLYSAGYTDLAGNFIAAHDAATTHLGEPWRMPTDEELQALISNCTTAWITTNGVSGRLVTGKGMYASRSIFLPAAGSAGGWFPPDANLHGGYWSLTSLSNDSDRAFYLALGPDHFTCYRSYRGNGLSVRPVRGFPNAAIAHAAIAQAGVTAHLKLDSRTWHECSADVALLRYDASWCENGDEVRITDNGTVVATGVSGIYSWRPENPTSQHLFKLEILSVGKVVATEVARYAAVDSQGVCILDDWVMGFAGEQSIKAVNIPEGVLGIGQDTFRGLSSLECVTIPSTVTNIGDGAFADCDSIRAVTVPGWKCGIDFSSVTNLVISPGTTNIDAGAFAGCSSLVSVEIPASVKSVGNNAFDACSVLSQVRISDISSWCKIAFANANANPLFYAKQLVVDGKPLSGSFVIPDEIMCIGDYAFVNSTGMTSVVASSNLQHIGLSAFAGCRALKKVELPSSVTMTAGLFNGCNALREATIPAFDGRLSSVFSSYAELQKITILESETCSQLAPDFFAGCRSLEQIEIAEGLWQGITPDMFADTNLKKHYDSQGLWIDNGWVLGFAGERSVRQVNIPEGVVGIAHDVFRDLPLLKQVILPDSLKYIRRGAFATCTALENLVVPNAVECIDECAFENCTALQEVRFGTGLATIGARAFAGCASLLDIVLKDGVTEIGNEAFCGCWRMRGVTVPASVQRIGSGAFVGCTHLTDLTIPTNCGTLSDLFPDSPIQSVVVAAGETTVMARMFACAYQLQSVEVCKGVETLGWGAFMDCGTLTSLTLPESLTRIESEAFEHCTGIKKFAVPEAVTYLGAYAFSGCCNLEQIALPHSLESLENYTFAGCSALKSVVIPAAVTRLGASVFSGCTALNEVRFAGDAPTSINTEFFGGAPTALLVRVVNGSWGWDGVATSRQLPDGWPHNAAFAYRRTISFWNPTQLTVTFNANGGAPALTSVVESTGDGYALPEEPTREGYAFAGWWTAKTGGGQVRSSTLVTQTKAHTLYAHWEWVPEVVLDKKGGTVDAGQNVAIAPPQVQLFGELAWSAKNLPSGMKIDTATGEISGTPSVPGVYQIALTATPKTKGVKPETTMVTMKVSNFVDETLPVKDAYGPFVPGEAVSLKFADGADWKVTGLPDGMKWDKNLPGAAGAPTKPGNFTVYFARTDSSVSPSVEHKASSTFVVGPLPKLSVVAVGETYGAQVSGAGSYLANKLATLKATPAKTSKTVAATLFAGWYADESCEMPLNGDSDYRSQSFAYAMPTNDVTVYAKFIVADKDWVELEVPAEVAMGTKAAAEPIVVDICAGSLPTVKTSGTLPAGFKFTAKALDVKATKTTAAVHYEANSFYGTPTKSGVYVVTVTATTAGKKSVSKNVKFIVRAPGETLIDADWDAAGGKVTGMGVCAKGKSLTLKATANKNFVFAGWYRDAEFTIPAEGSVDYRTASFAVADNGTDQKLYACFVPSSEDVSVVALIDERYDLNGPWEQKLDIDSLSLPTVTVPGLPAGLKFNAKTLTISGTPTKPGTYTVKLTLKNVTVKKSVTQTFTINVANIESPYLTGIDYAKDAYRYYGGVSVGWDIGSCAQGGYAVANVIGLPTGLKFDSKTGRIAGVPTKAGTFTATITLKNGKLSSLATITMTAEDLSAWACGTFDGGCPSGGQMQLTVSNVGKISGKLYRDGIVYTLSAPSYSSFDGCRYYAELTASWSVKEDGKTVKKTETWPVWVRDNVIGGYVYVDMIEGGLVEAYQNVWTQKAWKDLGASLFGKTGMVKTLSGSGHGLGEDESIEMTIKSDGKVTLKGKFNTGKVDSRGNPVYYSATGSAMVCVMSGEPFKDMFESQIFIYFAPNEAKGFWGYSDVVSFSEVGCHACSDMGL